VIDGVPNQRRTLGDQKQPWMELLTLYDAMFDAPAQNR
jgi:hypothetical protein